MPFDKEEEYIVFIDAAKVDPDWPFPSYYFPGNSGKIKQVNQFL